MSSAYLIVGLLATFSAVLLFSYAVSASGADKRRAFRVLESAVGSENVSLREQKLEASLVRRTANALVERLGPVVRRITPKGMIDSMDKKIALARMSKATSADQVILLKVVGGLSAFVLLLMWGQVRALTTVSSLLLAALFGAIAYFAPDVVLAGRADTRRDEIRKALPDTMDLLTISVEAGLGLDAAIARVVAQVPGPLSEEFNRMLQEMRLGMPRSEALKELKERTDIEELDAFVLAIIQADTFGVSIANVLRTQAVEVRTKRRQRAEEKAMKIPVKMLFPLIFCVLPALFVVIIGPGVIRIAESFIGS